MAGTPALVIFYGGAGASEIEQTLDRARLASALDTIETAQAAGIEQTILVTDDPGMPADLAGVTMDCSTRPYHFGRRLAEVIRKHDLTSVVYAGAGSTPLFTAADFADIARRLAGGMAVTNNFYSSDLIAFDVTEAALATVECAERDNALARALKDAGVAMETLPRSATTLMDIDSPGDLAVLTLTGGGRPRLRDCLAELRLDTSRLAAVSALFTKREAQVMVAGRVGSHIWSQLESETACRVRLFAEERGMVAERRWELGTARSLLGFFLEAAGMERFFAALPELGDAAVIDTRVLLAHKGIDASREDRFLSDVGEWEGIREPFLREFTERAVKATMPVVLGGHSLVSGGLLALNDKAWIDAESLASNSG